jgi:hypothetical protein
MPPPSAAGASTYRERSALLLPEGKSAYLWRMSSTGAMKILKDEGGPGAMLTITPTAADILTRAGTQ